MKYFLVMLFFIFFPAGIPAAEEDIPATEKTGNTKIDKKEGGTIGNCDGFIAALSKCEPYKCQRNIEPGSSIENYFLGHEITGLSKDGKCHHIQTVSDGIIECYYSEKMRHALVRVNSGGNISREDTLFVNESFSKECLFKDKSESGDKDKTNNSPSGEPKKE